MASTRPVSSIEKESTAIVIPTEGRNGPSGGIYGHGKSGLQPTPP